MSAQARAERGIVDRDHGRAKQHRARCESAARSAAQSLRQAHVCVDRADRALRRVEGTEGDAAVKAEAEAYAVRAAHERCERAARQAGAAARRGDVKRAESSALAAAGALADARSHAAAAGKAAAPPRAKQSPKARGKARPVRRPARRKKWWGAR